MNTNCIPFWKASACGNDFLLIDGALAPAQIEEFTRGICDRNNGVGADGIEWLYPADEDFHLRIRLINADGSHAEVSGNGTRSVAAWYVAQHGGDVVRIATDAGVKVCELTGRSGNEFSFRTAMGGPQVSAAISVPVQGKRIEGVPVNIGNPQFIVFVEQFPNNWQQIAREIQAQAQYFPEGVNVEFVELCSEDEIAIRIFERGAGETLSSGTGSSASAAAAMAAKGLPRRLRVHAPGGSQVVEWEPDGGLFLYGPARLICRGEFFL
jgi:diaminopimelate epimerase